MNNKLFERLIGAHQALLRGATEDATKLVLSAIEMCAEQKSKDEYAATKLGRDVPIFLLRQAD